MVGLGHSYTLKDPTYEEALDFLRLDKTNENEYIEGVYICIHFASDVSNNAEAAGFRSALVDVLFPQMGHTLVAFRTIDEGLVYFDPQTDERVRPVIGRRYHQCIEPEPGYTYSAPPFDDTIMDIVLSW